MRYIYFLSDQTGVTVETLGHSLITQFDYHDFHQVTLPFIDSEDKAKEAVLRINSENQNSEIRMLRARFPDILKGCKVL